MVPRFEPDLAPDDSSHWGIRHWVAIGMGIDDSVLDLTNDLEVLEPQLGELAQRIFCGCHPSASHLLIIRSHAGLSAGVALSTRYTSTPKVSKSAASKCDEASARRT